VSSCSPGPDGERRGGPPGVQRGGDQRQDFLLLGPAALLLIEAGVLQRDRHLVRQRAQEPHIHIPERVHLGTLEVQLAQDAVAPHEGQDQFGAGGGDQREVVRVLPDIGDVDALAQAVGAAVDPPIQAQRLSDGPAPFLRGIAPQGAALKDAPLRVGHQDRAVGGAGGPHGLIGELVQDEGGVQGGVDGLADAVEGLQALAGGPLLLIEAGTLHGCGGIGGQGLAEADFSLGELPLPAALAEGNVADGTLAHHQGDNQLGLPAVPLHLRAVASVQGFAGLKDQGTPLPQRTDNRWVPTQVKPLAQVGSGRRPLPFGCFWAEPACQFGSGIGLFIPEADIYAGDVQRLAYLPGQGIQHGLQGLL
jgi:hypothetical protein